MKKILILFLISLCVFLYFNFTNSNFLNLGNLTGSNVSFPGSQTKLNVNYKPGLKRVKIKIKANSETLSKNCRILWRYSFVCALKYALNSSNIAKVKTLAEELESNTTRQDVWNILEWEGKNLKYNWSKATLPPTVVEYYGSSVKIVRKGIWYQTPEETLKMHSGICGDYAIFTSALLLDMNVTPYPVVVNFTSEMGHAAVLVKIDGWYFVLDQHLPPMDLGTYYREWKYYRTEFGERTIKDMHIYEVQKGREAKVKDLGIITAREMLKEDYNLTDRDLKALCYGVMKEFENLGLKADPVLSSLRPGSYLPPGYSDGRYWTFTFPHYADYYNPVFYRQYVHYFYAQICRGAVKEDAEGCNRVWVSCIAKSGNLTFNVLLARYG